MPPSFTPPPRLVLASSSRYRASLLERLRLPFDIVAPNTDETPVDGETPQALAERLAFEKAASVATHNDDALIIGSDQVAWLDGHRLSKPLDRARARAQLTAASGRWLQFFTAVCLLDARSGHYATRVSPIEVRFRDLTPERIEAYLAREAPLDCAGSFKAEGLGISLLAEMRGTDPTALVGLPLIALCSLLEDAGVEI